MAQDSEPIYFVEVDSASRNPEHVYYGRTVQFSDTALFLKDPIGAGRALKTVIAADMAGLDAGAAGRDGMELVPDAVPQVFRFFDAHTGTLAVAWRILCRDRVLDQTH